MTNVGAQVYRDLRKASSCSQGEEEVGKLLGERDNENLQKNQLACPKNYKKWTDKAMQGALKAIAEGMGVNRAAMEYGVPRTTLKDRVAGRVQHG